MKKQNNSLTDAKILRQKAEEQLKKQQAETNLSFSETDMLKLIHELEVHQIELEMQNEELVVAKEKTEFAEEKYTELFDFAPSGYITLSKERKIKELNFEAARMLGKERSHIIKTRFDLFIIEKKRSVFNLFFDVVFTSKEKQTCEVILSNDGNVPIHVLLTGIITENIEQCNVTMVDITNLKQAEEGLAKHRDHMEELVKERTKELETRNKELESFHNLFVGREFRIKELRDKVADLEKRLDI